MSRILEFVTGLNPWLLVGVAVVVAGLSGAVYVEHSRAATAEAALGVAQHDRDQWKANFTTADETAKPAP